MPRYGQIVLGPAGSGKSRYCSRLLEHAQTCGRQMHVVNLDPAAEYFDYEPLADIRDLIQLEDVMEDGELQFGPNGGLVFCLEFLLENINWLEDILTEVEDDYILFDCPGQIELYTHLPVMKQLTQALLSWNFRLCAVFLLDSHFMIDGGKFISGSTLALTIMTNLELPHVNVLSKIDLLSGQTKKKLDMFLNLDVRELQSMNANPSRHDLKYERLTHALGRVLEDYSLIQFFPLDQSHETSIGDLLHVIDNTIQYGEDEDVKAADFNDEDPPDIENGDDE